MSKPFHIKLELDMLEKNLGPSGSLLPIMWEENVEKCLIWPVLKGKVLNRKKCYFRSAQFRSAQSESAEPREHRQISWMVKCKIDTVWLTIRVDKQLFDDSLFTAYDESNLSGAHLTTGSASTITSKSWKQVSRQERRKTGNFREPPSITSIVEEKSRAASRSSNVLETPSSRSRH